LFTRKIEFEKNRFIDILDSEGFRTSI